MDSRKVQNGQLHALIKEATWSGQNLAEAVNAVGREAKLSFTYSRSSVGQWIAGMTPRRPGPHVVAEALSRRLGRAVTPREAGFGEAAGDAERHEGDSLRLLITLATATAPRNFGISPYRIYSLTGPGYPSSAAAVAEEAWRVPAADPLKRSMRVGRKDVESADVMLRLFADAEAASGAGHVRPGLGLYLANTIAPVLYAATSEIRAELLPVAARLARLGGQMCYDDGLHGFAQHYYQVALRFAVEAVEIGIQGLVLRAMSAQAVSLGHYDHALGLAREAVDVAVVDQAAAALPAPELATLFGQRAVAHAAVGDRAGALADMAEAGARARLGRANGDDTALRDAVEVMLAYQRGVMLAMLGDVPNAITQMELSARRRPSMERHWRAITLSRVAALQMRQGHLEGAIATWHRFLDDYPAINSGRARTALSLLQSEIRPYQGNPAARALLGRAMSIQQRLPHVAAGRHVGAAGTSQDIRVRFPMNDSHGSPLPA